MRKKTFYYIFDTILWALIALLPLIIWVFGNIHNNLELNSIFSTLGVVNSGVVYDTLVGIFGNDGVLPLFSNNSNLALFFTYFVNVSIVHLLIDFILFIPKLCHKWLDKITNDGV